MSDLVAMAVWFAVVGLVGGVLWWLLVTPAEYLRHAGRLSMGQLELARRFGADGWFVVLGLVLGVLSGLVVVMWRRRDPLHAVLLGAAGAVLAGYLTLGLGSLLGDPGNLARLGEAVREGGKVASPLDLHWMGELLVWPVGFLVGAASVLLGSRPELFEPDRPADPDESLSVGRSGP